MLWALDFLCLFLLTTDPSYPKVWALFGSITLLFYSISTLAFCLELFLDGIDGATLELRLSNEDFFDKNSSLFPSTSLIFPLMITIFNCCSITKLFCWTKSSSSLLLAALVLNSLIFWTLLLSASVLYASFKFLRVVLRDFSFLTF